MTGAGNKNGKPLGYPALFGDPANANHIPDLIVVGSVDSGGEIPEHPKNYADWLTCFAPGERVYLPDPNYGGGTYAAFSGTSYCKFCKGRPLCELILSLEDRYSHSFHIVASATVAGLAAYFRSLNPDGLLTVAAVKQEILRFAYQRSKRPEQPDSTVFRPRVIWNAQLNGRSLVGKCDTAGSGGAKNEKRDDSCPMAVPPSASPITFRSGPASPTCISGSRCGSLSKGYYCEGSPLNQNPDFLDPRHPDSVQNPNGPNFGDWDGNMTATRTPALSQVNPTSSGTQTSTRNPVPSQVTPAPSKTQTTTRSYPHPVPTPGGGLNVLEIVLISQHNLNLDGFYNMEDKIGGTEQDPCAAPYAKIVYDGSFECEYMDYFPELRRPMIRCVFPAVEPPAFKNNQSAVRRSMGN